MITIRPESEADLSAIRHLNEVAFEQPDESRIVDALRRERAVTLSLVADMDGVIVGHILFSPVRIVDASGSFAVVGLAPMAVLPEHQRRGIGSRLVETGLDQLRRGTVRYRPEFSSL